MKLWLQCLIGSLTVTGCASVAYLVTGSVTVQAAAGITALICWSAGLIVGGL